MLDTRLRISLMLLLVLTGIAFWVLFDRERPTSETKPARPNLILISVDTLRADHLSCYGYERETSPNFDRLAAQGVRMTYAFSPASWTVPGHATMLTGLNPLRHGAISARTPIRSEVPLLAEILSAEGYATRGVATGAFVKPAFGFGRGFESYRVFAFEEAEAHQNAIIETVKSPEPRPFFYFFHFNHVHAPYRPPASGNPFERKYESEAPKTFDVALQRWKAKGGEGPLISLDETNQLIDQYDGGILAMDALLAELLDALDAPELANTYVILTADHGEEFMEHGFLYHGFTLYDEVIRVPLLIRGPGVPANRRVDSIAGLVDVVPTALDLLGVEELAGLDGQSLRTTWEEGAAPERNIVLQTNLPTGGPALLGVRTNEFKLLYSPEGGVLEYYELEEDPAELEKRPLTAQAEQWRDRLDAASQADSEGDVDMSPEEIESLRALGYLDM